MEVDGASLVLAGLKEGYGEDVDLTFQRGDEADHQEHRHDSDAERPRLCLYVLNDVGNDSLEQLALRLIVELTFVSPLHHRVIQVQDSLAFFEN